MNTQIKIDESISRPEWLKFLIENYDKEGLASKSPMLPDEGRESIWQICKSLDHDKYGIPGEACRLLERYMEKTFFTKVDDNSESDYIEEQLKLLRKDLEIVIGCCIMLAIKMSRRLPRPDEKIIRLFLFDNRYEMQDVIKKEFEVFKVLDFYIPSKNVVEVCGLLAEEIKLSSIVLKNIDYVMNLAELRRPKVEEKVRWVVNISDAAICTLHFAAGGVLATVYYVEYYTHDPLIPLSRLTGASVDYIKCIAAAILTQALKP